MITSDPKLLAHVVYAYTAEPQIFEHKEKTADSQRSEKTLLETFLKKEGEQSLTVDELVKGSQRSTNALGIPINDDHDPNPSQMIEQQNVTEDALPSKGASYSLLLLEVFDTQLNITDSIGKGCAVLSVNYTRWEYNCVDSSRKLLRC